MKIQGRKVMAFMTTWMTMLMTAVLTIIFAPEQWKDFSKWFVIGLLANAFVFVSFTVLKDFIKSKWFNQSLFNQGVRSEDVGKVHQNTEGR